MLDVICVIDSRFEGGTAAAAASDVTAFLNDGQSVGLVEVRSSYIKSRSAKRSAIIDNLCQDNRVICLPSAQRQKHRARTVFLHHPMTFYYGLDQPIQLEADHAYLVAHHLPFRGDGSLQYDPITTTQRARYFTGVSPMWAPVSGLCRQQLRSFSPLIRLASQDWPNVFDVDAWQPKKETFTSDTITIGRHGRSDLLKWPETAQAIADSLPTLPKCKIRVMGLPADDIAAMGVDTDDWTILPFNAEPVPDFLDQLDVFVYHFHPDASESFGRTVAEAMLMGALCILDPRLKPTFGNLAVYCDPHDTARLIENMRHDPVGSRHFAAKTRDAICETHRFSSVPSRLKQLNLPVPQEGVQPNRSENPIQVMRKIIGLMRRHEFTLSDLQKMDR
ncbi:hypothetical protein FHS72_000882 [Loktanella ponticola]|uniref:Glycosyltransferase family 1 protein n=1 Tax=Yoonia ponticola TaxID=1524255 RepID=A0A7W9BIS7_9RHOB|nr:glycosyltransferase family 1 protein [Yoonia ponticola]MBB5721275.1 hypothetical protein [Yoonia ponticola]